MIHDSKNYGQVENLPINLLVAYPPATAGGTDCFLFISVPARGTQVEPYQPSIVLIAVTAFFS